MEERADILIVDDLPEKLLVFETILAELGQNLVKVRSGSEALKEVLQREFAVILLDVNMPDIDGLETASLIRKYRKSAHTPIIFITAYADEMQTAQGYSLGAVDYILSPVNADVLRSKVRAFVDLHILKRRAQAVAAEQSARRAAEESNRRSQFLARASHELGASLDLEGSLRNLLSLIVPRMALAAALQVDGGPDGTIILHRADFGQGTEIRKLPSLDELPGELALPLRDSAAGRAAVDGGGWPLRNGDSLLGALSVQLKDAPDLANLGELIERSGVALENARLYSTLQREMARSREAERMLQDVNRRKDEFLAMLSHELRNPLAPIRNAVEVMRRLAPADPELVMARDVVERQVTQLARLVEELLDAARISQGKIMLRREPVELSAVIQHSVETARPSIDGRQQRLVVDLPSSPVWISGDAARLSQVVSNLLNNASKYTPKRGRLELGLAVRDGEAVIRVRDNGAGIEPELLPRVFELFVQGDRSLDRGQGGLGIGLTLVQRLVELHHGRVKVQSEGLGRGSCFEVHLPSLSAVPNAATAGSAPVDEARRHGRRVLVVDDNVDAAETTGAYLRLEGHEVKCVHDGHAALAAVAVFAPHVILLDIGLPGLDGYAVAREVRAKGGNGHILLIALTGYGQAEDQAKAVAAGFDCHFTKPADPRMLQKAIERGRTTGPQVIERRA